ncbi:MAG: type I-E CRISPR-associated protein Cse2/CasB [Dissulfurispiraceae bacterium]
MSAFMERLRRYADDRGMMANLRCILVDTKKHRAWPVLNRIGVNVMNNEDALIAGLFATHQDESQVGNFGVTCKSIEYHRGEKPGDNNKLTPTERRFQHLLAAEKGEELYQRITRMVLMAKSQGVPVNYEQLATDLKRWNDRTKTEWAASFWTQGSAPASEEDV